MKKSILTLLATLALLAPAVAHAKPARYTVLLAGGAEANMIHIWRSVGGNEYVIDSVVQLDVGSTICAHPAGNPNELICSAPMIAGFEVNAGGGDDQVEVAKSISIPVTMRGGDGRDVLSGGAGPDKLIGGYGNDRLIGGRGDDFLLGGEGKDVLIGGPADDVLRGGYGKDTLIEGTGDDSVHQEFQG